MGVHNSLCFCAVVVRVLLVLGADDFVLGRDFTVTSSSSSLLSPLSNDSSRRLLP